MLAHKAGVDEVVKFMKEHVSVLGQSHVRQNRPIDSEPKVVFTDSSGKPAVTPITRRTFDAMVHGGALTLHHPFDPREGCEVFVLAPAVA